MVHLRHMTDNDETGMRRLVGIYLKETASGLKKLEKAVQQGLAEEIHLIAHGCKGASAAYGMTAITPIFQEMEIQGREKKIEKTVASLHHAQTAFKAIQSYWTSYLEGTSDKKAA
jgi:HPt (histidine-containing phosphotransfer) domain-containing protein